MDSWILVATALVIFMSIPGVALFYGGLVSAKNVVSILTQSMALVGVVTITLLVAGNAIMGNGFSISAVADGFMLMNASQGRAGGNDIWIHFRNYHPHFDCGRFCRTGKVAFCVDILRDLDSPPFIAP